MDEAPEPLAAVALPIPTGRDREWASRVVWMERSGPYAEAFRHLAVRVRTELGSRGASSLMITSALPQEGKTLTACNLALALASLTTTERVALVDLDLRVPSVSATFGVQTRVGVGEVLAGDASLQTVVVATDAGLDLYPVAARYLAAHQLLGRSELPDLMKQLETRYRWVICDTGPALLVPDVQIIAPHVGACLAVVRSGRTPRSALRALGDRLPQGKMIGFFLNDARPPAHARRYYRSSYYSADPAPPEEAS